MTETIGGKSFKFSASLNEVEKNIPALPNDKKLREFVLSMIFSQQLIFNGIKISKLHVNADDSDGKPDILTIVDGVDYGIQITKLSLNDPLRRINISEKKTGELLGLIPDDYTVDNLLNVYIYLNAENKNDIPKGNQKQSKILVEEILDCIESNKEKLFINKEIVLLKIEKSELATLAKAIAIFPVNIGYKSRFTGKNNIHINYEFDLHEWNEDDLNNEIQRILEKKMNSYEDILLIWGDRFELLYQDLKIYDILKQRFYNTRFKNVFFMTLDDRIDSFWESWRLMVVKHDK